MASLPVYDRTGAEVDTYQIDPATLAPRINKQLLHDAVVMYQANRRQGSAKTKSRGEITGASQKMYRQKGRGVRGPARAAAGSAGVAATSSPSGPRIGPTGCQERHSAWPPEWPSPRKSPTTR